MKNNDFLLEWQKVDVKSECLYSLLTVMGLSLSEAEEDDIKKCLFIASSIAGEITEISSEVEVKLARQGQINEKKN
ncbi:hypothetical protein OW944_23420 [Klebsiella pneumoniae]|uniref:hypothetical protein n=1 Tax=Enterobacterales TaxID=91347 RepID=UPI000E5D9C0D|nr:MULTISPECIES: hypothetical protein [Enterobacterales]MDU4748284.1 hypothetical protein [Pantoea sp.]AXZ12050.1 hypothetical protein AM455_04470 [Klebsiella pneumoniae]MCQ5472505.1 hypothetical protein [Pantoea brenneri]MCS5752354.1 hypothetical protein [Klebsiella quasipneumoniae subsp. quasipneumoniae]MCY0500322.1 hypothetical protein [Klebsiella pneumoniae]